MPSRLCATAADSMRGVRSARRCARSASAARTRAGSPTARRTGSQSARSRVNLVYIISAYRLPEQLVRLVTRLRTENATFLVHIDKKVLEVFGAVAEGVGSLPEVHLLDRHVPDKGFVTWPCRFDGIAAIVENGIPCDQAVLLTDRISRSRATTRSRLVSHSRRFILSHSWSRTTRNGCPTAKDRIDRRYFNRDEACRCRARAGREGSARP